MANCCVNCFNDEYVRLKIETNGSVDDCDYCNSQGIKCIGTDQLEGDFVPLMMLYEETTYGEHYGPDDDPSDKGEYLDDLIQDEWQVFSDDIDLSKRNELLFDILNSSRDYMDSYDAASHYSKASDSFTYVSSQEVWDEFCREIKHQNRFFLRHRLDTELADVLKRQEKILPPEFTLFRARLGGQTNQYNMTTGPHLIESMTAPPAIKAKGGRANPIGISYLYTATNIETVISEIRPYKGALISVATMLSAFELKMVDLTEIDFFETPFGYPNLRAEIEQRMLLWRLSEELSTPIDPERSEFDYLPLQYLTELIKHLQYDGLIFQSSLGPGNNMVLFDSNNIQITMCELYEVNEMRYTYNKANLRGHRYRRF